MKYKLKRWHAIKSSTTQQHFIMLAGRFWRVKWKRLSGREAFKFKDSSNITMSDLSREINLARSANLLFTLIWCIQWLGFVIVSIKTDVIKGGDWGISFAKIPWFYRYSNVTPELSRHQLESIFTLKQQFSLSCKLPIFNLILFRCQTQKVFKLLLYMDFCFRLSFRDVYQHRERLIIISIAPNNQTWFLSCLWFWVYSIDNWRVECNVRRVFKIIFWSFTSELSHQSWHTGAYSYQVIAIKS